MQDTSWGGGVLALYREAVGVVFKPQLTGTRKAESGYNQTNRDEKRNKKRVHQKNKKTSTAEISSKK